MGATLLPDAVLVSFAGAVLSVTVSDGTFCFSRRRRSAALAPSLSGLSNLSTSTSAPGRTSEVTRSGGRNSGERSATFQSSESATKRRWDLSRRVPNTSRETSCLQAGGSRSDGDGSSDIGCWNVPCTLIRERLGCRTKQSTRRFPRPRSTSPRMRLTRASNTRRLMC